MKTTEQIKDRRSLAECRMLDTNNKETQRYHQGWMDALEWVEMQDVIKIVVQETRTGKNGVPICHECQRAMRKTSKEAMSYICTHEDA